MKKQAITFGRIGILIPIAVIIPVLGALAGLAALVLLMVSHYYFSKFYEDYAIFKDALIGTIVSIGANIIGGIIITIAVGASAISFSGNDVEFTGIQNITKLIFESGLTITGALIMLAGLIIGYYYIFKSLGRLAQQSGVKLFRTAGLLYFIGAIGIIVFFIGSLIILVAWILHIVAYFSIQQDKETTKATA